MSYKKNAEVAQRFLDKADWNYVINYDHPKKQVNFFYDIGGYRGIYKSFRSVLRVNSNMFKVVTFFPSSIQNSNIVEIVEFATRANGQLSYGAFKVDFDFKEIYFDIAFPITIINGEIDELDEILHFDFLLSCGAKMFDSYSYGFAKIIMGELTPARAIIYSNEMDRLTK